MKNNPYYGYPHGGSAPAGNNSKKNFAIGLAAGAAIATLLSNKKVQSTVSNTGSKAWSAVRGEMEELKERLEDTQAELDYYRNLNKDTE
ncbi:MAG: YtxH domain-containing protein [Psychromonas sp.]|nr:YtxH domain-containing protein [Alteromonadales bacterium]MCP5078445.1 YtxH domain-containing protein [Psychromonas sp.]